MTQKRIAIFSIIFLMCFPPLLYSGVNDSVEGYKKPRICITGSNRCYLKRFGNVKYWCLKSAKQNVLDVRRTTTPIKKTYREKLGHCAKILPVIDE